MVRITISIRKSLPDIEIPVSDALFWRILQILNHDKGLTLRELERKHIIRACAERGDKSYREVAEELGISSSALQNRRYRYGLVESNL